MVAALFTIDQYLFNLLHPVFKVLYFLQVIQAEGQFNLNIAKVLQETCRANIDLL